MSVIVDTGLTSRAIVGRFYRQLEEFAKSAWWTALAMQFQSNQPSETYRWLGMVPQVREWVGGRQVQPLRASGVTIANKTWEATVRVDADELRRDKSGQIMLRVSELARRVATHPNRLLTTLVEAGETTACYDGQFFFDTDHSEGSSGTQDNALTYNAITPTAPADIEMRDAILRAIAQILSFKDDQGEPMNDTAREFLVMVPSNFLSATLAALASRELDATTNPLAAGKHFKVSWIANPRLSWTTKFAVFRTDGLTRPFIFQEELPVQVQVLAEGSELEINENQHQYGVKAIHACGYGFWQDACLVTFY
ncbi:MAG: Mu-like prophage major head subunit gpT family protein [Phycisphaerales bacterium]|nr:Mu-like prophage major head subunit gpT family protein [Phycisphaerales bacterium]